MTQPSARAFAAGMIAQERWRGCGAGGLARSRLRDRNETGARLGRRLSGDLRAGSAAVEMDLVGLGRRAGDRKGVVAGRSVAVRVEYCGRRLIKTKHKNQDRTDTTQ